MELYNEDKDAVTWYSVIRSLIGKRVIIFTEHQSPMGGTLADFNGYIVKTINSFSKNDKQATYYPVGKIISITEINDEY